MGTSKSKIKLEKSDSKGMLNLNAITEFASKANKAICEIKMPNGGFGSGFFCKIPYTENDDLLLPVLITCNHVLNIDSISTQNINIIINGKKNYSLKTKKKMDR